jgi:excisionase family DNA binding protein
MRENPSLLMRDTEVAAALGCGRSKVWSLVKSGLLTPVKLPPRTTRFRRREVERLAETGGSA